MGAQERGSGPGGVLRRDLGLWIAADLRSARRVAGAGEPLPTPEIRAVLDSEFLLVTPGGGGDGEALIDLVLQAYEYDPDIPLPALLVYGPFMLPEQQLAFTARAARLPNIHAITFDARLEALMARAAGVVAMGGYNTFCEILSFDKPALIVPRTVPRMEQLIRAERAAELGLVTMLAGDNGRDPKIMATALRRLTRQSCPSSAVIPGLLDGMLNVNRLAGRWLGRGRVGRLAAGARIGV